MHSINPAPIVITEEIIVKGLLYRYGNSVRTAEQFETIMKIEKSIGHANLKLIDEVMGICHVAVGAYESEIKAAAGVLLSYLKFKEPKNGVFDTLQAMYQGGPLYAGDLPSKAEKSRLMDEGCCVMVVTKGNLGDYALNWKGYYLYKVMTSSKIKEIEQLQLKETINHV